MNTDRMSLSADIEKCIKTSWEIRGNFFRTMQYFLIISAPTLLWKTMYAYHKHFIHAKITSSIVHYIVMKRFSTDLYECSFSATCFQETLCWQE